MCYVCALASTIHTRCIYGIFGRKITKFAVICGVYVYGSGRPKYVFFGQIECVLWPNFSVL